MPELGSFVWLCVSCILQQTSRLCLYLFYTLGRKFPFHASLTFCTDSAKSVLTLNIKPGGTLIGLVLLLFEISV